jgi:hypothetical protein
MASSQKVAQIYSELVLQTAQFKAALGDAGTATRQWSAQMRHETEEAKGSIALLGEQIGVVLPRHLRTFVAGLPGVTTAMSAAFNAIAIFALIDVVVKAGEKIEEFASKAENAGEKNKQAWDKSTGSLKLQTEEIELSNVKLENQIAKLEHKPQNGLAEALIEARIEAQRLSEKLLAANDDALKLLKSQSAGVLAQLVGHGGTDYEQTMVQQHTRWIAQQSTPQGQLNESKSFGASLNTRLTELQGWQDHPSATRFANNLPDEIQAVKDLIAQQRVEQSLIEASMTHGADQQTADKLTKQNENNKASLEAQRKADEERLKQFQLAFDQQKTAYGMDAAQERSYWENKLSSFKVGSSQYLSVFEKYTSASLELTKQFEKIRKESIGSNEPAPVFGTTRGGSGDNALAAATTRNTEAQAQLNSEWAQAKERIDVLTGAITPHQAALDAAAMHADEYRAKLTALQNELTELHANDGLAAILGPDKETQAKQQGVQTQIDELTGKYRIQKLEDAQSALDTTWRGMVDNVWDELIKRSQQTQQELQHIATQFVDGINSQLAKGMTGQKMNFSGVFQSASEGLAKSSLEKVEGGAAKAFGLGGKRTGNSPNDAIYTINVGGSGAASMPNLSGIFRNTQPKVTGPGGAGIENLGL